MATRKQPPAPVRQARKVPLFNFVWQPAPKRPKPPRAKEWMPNFITTLIVLMAVWSAWSGWTGGR